MTIKWDVSLEEALETVQIMRDVSSEEGPPLKILDVGGAIKPLVYATHVIDILPYDNRAWFGHISHETVERADEAFTVETWLQADVCDTPWPYEDNFFDVIWCTQTVEDVRDPIAVIREMARVGKVGFVETIHRDFESLLDVERQANEDRPNYAGYMHHRWLIEQDGDRVKFTQKFPHLHIDARYNPAMTGKRFLGFWWTNTMDAWEYIPMSPEEIHDWLFNYAEETRRKDAAGEAQ